MVEQQLRARGIRDPAVLDAFAKVPRDRFVPDAHRSQAYEDHPLPIGKGQTISQPYVVALMTQELGPEPHHRVLDVGAGSGYQTAILACLGGHVYALERIDELTRRATAAIAESHFDNVTIRTGDGSLGWPEEAPFDRILCGAAAPDVPQAWIDQLADGGRIVVPVGGLHAQTLIAIDKRGGRVRRRDICDVRFVRLIGQDGWRE